MIYAVPVQTNTQAFEQTKALYESAFPENERGPFAFLIEGGYACSEVYAFYDGNVYCGFISLLLHQDICHIIYFAVPQALRNRGYGAQILNVLKETKKGMRIIADLECIDEKREDNVQRIKRKQFYLKAGYQQTDIHYLWKNDAFEILILNGNMHKKEFDAFWEKMYSLHPNFHDYL